jgi:hypothetical protein
MRVNSFALCKNISGTIYLRKKGVANHRPTNKSTERIHTKEKIELKYLLNSFI